jgi:hypothetical protein
LEGEVSRQKLLTTTNLLALALVLLTGCSADCEWSATVRTWVDKNADGVWDSDELPLPNVNVFVESYDIPGIPEAVSNEEGEAHLYALLGGCPRGVVFFVYALPPPGHRPSIRSLKPATEADERMFEFGFIPLNE